MKYLSQSFSSLLLASTLVLSACGGGGGGNNNSDDEVEVIRYQVSASASEGGSISPESISVENGRSVSFTLTPDAGFVIGSAEGCNGTLTGSTYRTGAISEDCIVVASFVGAPVDTFEVSTSASSGGVISPSTITVNVGETVSLDIIADSGFDIQSVTGCGGSLAGEIYTTGPISADCTVNASFTSGLGSVPDSAAQPALDYIQTKTFFLTWSDVADATYYRLLENVDGQSGFVQVGEDIPQGTQQYEYVVPLYERLNAVYLLESCNVAGCISAAPVSVEGNLAGSVGYFKASNPEATDRFGSIVALSDDGSTLAVATANEDGLSAGINGDQAQASSGYDSGAVYIFVREPLGWVQQAYIKASNAEEDDNFGWSMDLSDSGDVLVVGAALEDSSATGVSDSLLAGGDNDANGSGAVYVFRRTGTAWSQEAYLKASNSLAADVFGSSVAISGDGNTIIASAPGEDGGSTGVNGNQTNQSTTTRETGAAYIFSYSGSWVQQAYLKASNAERFDGFGNRVQINENGNAVAITAWQEDSNAQGVNGDEADNSTDGSGAVYIFSFSSSTWVQQAYIKASNTEVTNTPFSQEEFGYSLGLSGSGDTLIVGAPSEASAAPGIDGDQSNNALPFSGAVYVYQRSGDNWSFDSYLKASNNGTQAYGAIGLFGNSVDISEDGSTIVVGAPTELNSAYGIGEDQNNVGPDFVQGAVYVFNRTTSSWAQTAYVKPPTLLNNQVSRLGFGDSISISGNGETLAVGAPSESGPSAGVNGNQVPPTITTQEVGAVYLF